MTSSVLTLIHVSGFFPFFSLFCCFCFLSFSLACCCCCCFCKNPAAGLAMLWQSPILDRKKKKNPGRMVTKGRLNPPSCFEMCAPVTGKKTCWSWQAQPEFRWPRTTGVGPRSPFTRSRSLMLVFIWCKHSPSPVAPSLQLTCVSEVRAFFL